MDKEALLSIILSDIKEIETLLKSFQGKSNISNAFIVLTERKIQHLSEELNMLKAFSDIPQELNTKEKTDIVTQNSTAIIEPVQKEVIVEKPIIEPTIEKNIIEETLIKEEIKVPEETINEEVAVEPEILPTPPVIEQLNEVEVVPEPIIEKETELPSSAIATEIKAETIEEPIKEAIITNNTESTTNKRLGETLQEGKNSVNDRVSHTEQNKKLLGKPVADLTKGLGINDRFLYQRELFNGNASLMTETLSQLNEMETYESAKSFLKANFSWDDEELSNNFYNYIQRRF